MVQRVFSGTITTLLLLAAWLAAGRAAAAEIILYDDTNFNGQSVNLTQSTPNLGNFDNKASSVRILSGAWILYRNANYGVTASRPSVTLSPGDYPDLANEGFPHNRLSSVRLIVDDVIRRPPVECPAPYRVLGAGGRCNWSCAPGTRPGPGGQCVCKPGLVETGTDNTGRRVCGPAQLAPPPAIPSGSRPDPRRPTAPVTVQSCTGPYRISLPQNGQRVCRWTCGQGTVPDEARGECVCDRGTVENGVDNRGRRICEALRATGEQFYSVGGDRAIDNARQRGFTFTATKTGPINATCTMSANVALASYRYTTVPGLVEPAGCILVLFGGRQLAPGWSFHRLEVFVDNDIGGDTGLEIRIFLSLGVRVKFHDPGQGATEATIESVMLRGPAGREWQDAFE